MGTAEFAAPAKAARRCLDTQRVVMPSGDAAVCDGAFYEIMVGNVGDSKVAELRASDEVPLTSTFEEKDPTLARESLISGAQWARSLVSVLREAEKPSSKAYGHVSGFSIVRDASSLVIYFDVIVGAPQALAGRRGREVVQDDARVVRIPLMYLPRSGPAEIFVVHHRPACIESDDGSAAYVQYTVRAMFQTPSPIQPTPPSPEVSVRKLAEPEIREPPIFAVLRALMDALDSYGDIKTIPRDNLPAEVCTVTTGSDGPTHTFYFTGQLKDRHTRVPVTIDDSLSLTTSNRSTTSESPVPASRRALFSLRRPRRSRSTSDDVA